MCPFSPFLVSFQESRLFHVDDIFPCHRFYVGQHCLSLCGESLFSSVLFFDIAICFDLLVNLLVTRYVLISSFQNLFSVTFTSIMSMSSFSSGE